MGLRPRQGRVFELKLHAFSAVPFVDAQPSDGVNETTARREQAFAEFCSDRSKRDGVERRAIRAAEAKADVIFADNVREPDLHIGENDKRFGVSRAERPGLRQLLD